jgi:hypothetical protein
MVGMFGKVVKHEVATVGGILQIWPMDFGTCRNFVNKSSWIQFGFNKKTERTATVGQCIVSDTGDLPHSGGGWSQSDHAGGVERKPVVRLHSFPFNSIATTGIGLHRGCGVSGPSSTNTKAQPCEEAVRGYS